MAKQVGPGRLDIVRAISMGLVATGALGGVGGLAYATGIEPNWLEVSRVTVGMPRLEPEFDGYRIVQISDIHLGEWMARPRFAQVVDVANEQRADLIAITGDFVTGVYKHAADDLVPELRRLRARDGVVAVLGNHDYWGKPGHWLIRQAINDSGLIDLNNDVHTLERGGAVLHLAGVDSVRERRHRLDQVLDKLPKDGASLLLAHEPDFADVSAKTGRFDLQISGHSHGGQVVIPFVGPVTLPPMGRKYPSGRYQVGDMALYTNRGVGVVGLPVRFFCRPEVTVFTLRCAPAQ